MEVYFASHKPIESLVPRPVKNYNSMGTWFTSSPVLARTLFGPIVYEFELPPGRYIEAHTDSFSEFFTNWPLAKETLSKKDFAYLEDHAPGTPDFDKKADRIVDKLLLDKEYVRGFREILENANFDGIVWRNSKIDVPRHWDIDHDVFLVFQKEHLYPLRTLEVEPIRERTA